MTQSNLDQVTINELSAMLKLSPHTLRMWERKLSIKTPRNDKGNRYYDSKAVELFKKIHSLLRYKLTLKEVENELKQEILSSNGENITYSKKEEYPKVEVIQNYKNDFDETNRIELFLKPYSERINQLESVNNKLIEENKILIAEKATLLERCSNMENNSSTLVLAKEEIITSINSNNKEFELKISDLNEKLKFLEENLNKKWWKFW